MSNINEKCEQYKGLLMGLMDNELTPEETEEVNSHLIRCEACRSEYDELQEASDKLKGIGFTEPQDAVLAKLWRSPHSRLTRNTGLFLVIGGWLALVIYGLYEAFITPDEALIPKIMLAVIIAGFAVLLGSVIRERLNTYKADPYKEVER